ncbi:MAG: inositol monophosphatase [Lasallia pustulata]|uniref:Inositol monophosphatase n=1 Tax=Lasallia pustulata TaxID=136370 RepID=A0A5M8PVI8_9LECA|nr:MAG: inositol monophosphatase [Lasallia pustulata]
MAEPNLQEIHDFLITLAAKAGEMITSAHPSMSNTDTKKNSSDLVTETDQAVEHMVSTSLKSAYPTYDFLGEETYTPGSSHLTPSPTFIVDPIDGTTNFVHSHPYLSISLAFVHHLTPLVGIVYNPFTHHLYSAIASHGAYLTTDFARGPLSRRSRLPLRQPPPPLTSLSEALVAVEWGNERSGHNWRVKTRTFEALAGGRTRAAPWCIRCGVWGPRR